MEILVEVTVVELDRVLAECRAIGAAMNASCRDIVVRDRTRRDGVWVFELRADQPRPRGEVLYLRWQ
ncbi:MAG: hypothetical protein M3285_02840 [Actinomycetota bacterium]|nr:hypothetical protein [Actinomycetota bacterium]MDQ3954468.1 hypothetical protein [Actinomycetota bacterium]